MTILFSLHQQPCNPYHSVRQGFLNLSNLIFYITSGKGGEKVMGLPISPTGQQSAPCRGAALEESHFNFSMLVFTADFQTGTKPRRKRRMQQNKGTRTQKCPLRLFLEHYAAR
jgi:hypothetical protein